ncbi:retrotransposon protein, putative, ty1-copia subclass [Tanacetum coccineum]
MLETLGVKLHGVPVTAFSEDGLSAIATKIDTPLMLDSYTSDMCMQSWGRSSYARAMIELQADVELKDNIVVVMPKITREGHYICNICVEYEWKPSRCASCKVFGHIPKECSKNIGVGETKKLKNTSQAPKGIPVGLNVGFKPHKEYRPVSKKTIANSSDGYQWRTSNLDNNGANSSGPSFCVTPPFLRIAAEANLGYYFKVVVFWNVENSSTSTTPIMDKIRKFENLIIDGQAIIVDETEMVGFGTQSLLEQLRDSYENGDYDEDSYDDDMYEGQDLPAEIQTICNNLDIRIRARKK